MTVTLHTAPKAEKYLRILVVEDAPAIQELLKLIISLQPAVESIHVAASGEEAIEALPQAAPDFVLMDYRLPGMDGLAAARRMKEIKPDIKIAMVTGWDDILATRDLREFGILDVISKTSISHSTMSMLFRKARSFPPYPPWLGKKGSGSVELACRSISWSSSTVITGVSHDPLETGSGSLLGGTS